MTEAAITRYITETFPGVSVVDSEGNAFFFHDSAFRNHDDTVPDCADD